MTADGTEAYPSRDDRIVAEFGDGYDVDGIAARYGLTVPQVYAVVEREVGPGPQDHPGPPGGYPPPPPGRGYFVPPPYQAQPSPPGHYPPPAAYAPPGPPQPFPPPQPFLGEDAIVAEYGEGYDVAAIARKHGINVEQVYEVVRRVVDDDARPPTGFGPPG